MLREPGRRALLGCAFALLAGAANAQTKVNLRFADVTTADAPRSVALVQIFAKEIGEQFEVQRGNLEMANLPPSDFANQAPEFDILGAAYVVRDAAHLDRIFRSEPGETFRRIAREKLGVVILAPAYYGVRHVNLKSKKRIQKPEDLAGVKLRMPGGEGWQFLGRSIGANPVPMAYAETYTGLQTGLIDGQDNPLVNTRLMKFHEVTSQIALTGHNIGFGLLIVRAQTFDALTPAQQQRMRAAAEKAFAWSTAEYLKQEQELVGFFKSAGLDVYTPDVQAFRTYAQRQYLQSPLSKSWPPGMLDRINGL